MHLYIEISFAFRSTYHLLRILNLPSTVIYWVKMVTAEINRIVNEREYNGSIQFDQFSKSTTQNTRSVAQAKLVKQIS